MEHNSYLIKAMDAYPYDLEETVEALNYALSFEPNNGMALCLMGRVYSEVYQDYQRAITYFEKALEDNLNMHTIYGHYASALICAKDLNKADTFLDFALSVKGADKALLFSCKAAVQEVRRDFKKARKLIKEAKLETFNDGFISSLEEMENRIKKKESLLKAKKGKGKKSKEKSEK